MPQTQERHLVWSRPFRLFVIFRPPVLATSSDSFKLMDTNKDGKVDGSDDAYDPYYPGERLSLTILHFPLQELLFASLPDTLWTHLVFGQSCTEHMCGALCRWSIY